MELLEHVLRRCSELGFRTSEVEPDSRLSELALSRVRHLVVAAHSFSLESDSLSGRLAVWIAGDGDQVLELADAFNDLLDDLDDSVSRFYIFSNAYILLDHCGGWPSASSIDAFLSKVVP